MLVDASMIHTRNLFYDTLVHYFASLSIQCICNSEINNLYLIEHNSKNQIIFFKSPASSFFDIINELQTSVTEKKVIL